MKTSRIALGLVAAIGLNAGALAAGNGHSVHVYKSPTCGCCQDWVDHMKENGFEVTTTDTDNMAQVKADAGLLAGLGSCHTAFVGDYVIEGHVPAQDVKRLLEEAPKAAGLSVPGMPMGSPGMEMGDRQDPYKVILFNEQGQTRIFSEYN